MNPRRICILILVILLTAVQAEAGRRAEFRFRDLNGKIYTPDSLRDRPLVIYVGSHL